MATRTHCARISTLLRRQNISLCVLLISRPSYFSPAQQFVSKTNDDDDDDDNDDDDDDDNNNNSNNNNNKMSRCGIKQYTQTEKLQQIGQI